MLINNIYYHIKPFIPRNVQIYLRRLVVSYKRSRNSHIWPVDESAFRLPNGWSGWPEKKRFALMLRHDVESLKGHDRCKELTHIEIKRGLRSAFYFVAKKYPVSQGLRHYLVSNGFEVGIHGLYHDGKLYRSRKIFQERAVQINQFLRQWQAVGFCSPATHRNLDWIHDLEIEYDSSTFDTDPFEPQPCGFGTIFPVWIQDKNAQKGYVELPYTMPQDFTLFILLKEKSIDIWKKKVDWIVQHSGMVVIPTHPDYIDFTGKSKSIEEYPVKFYEEILDYILTTYNGQYWNVVPRDVARYFVAGVSKG